MPERRTKCDPELDEGIVRILEETRKPIAQVARGTQAPHQARRSRCATAVGWRRGPRDLRLGVTERR